MQSLLVPKEPNFQKIIITSAVLHLLFLTLVAVPLKTKKKEYSSYVVNIVTPAQLPARREAPPAPDTSKGGKDQVTIKEPPRKRVRQEKTLLPEKKAAPDKGVSLKPSQTSGRERVAREIERIQAISSLARMKKKQEEAKAESLESLRQSIRGSVSIQSGIPGDVLSDSSNAYAALIRQKIWSEWIYPDIEASGLEVIISFAVNREGKVSPPRIVQSSGNSIYDSSAVKAIYKASPLPPPPVEEEFEVRFHL